VTSRMTVAPKVARVVASSWRVCGAGRSGASRMRAARFETHLSSKACLVGGSRGPPISWPTQVIQPMAQATLKAHRTGVEAPRCVSLAPNNNDRGHGRWSVFSTAFTCLTGYCLLWEPWLRLKLKVNETKSAVAQPEERKFLGFSIANDGSERRIAPNALAKFKARIREITRRTRGRSLPQIVEELKPYLIGWRSYFSFCQTPRVLTNLEAWIRRRLRMYLWRQWKNGPKRFKELRRRGVAKFLAAVAAGSPTGFWRMSGHPALQKALRNHVFDSLGLPRIYIAR
jgi:Group II intron, maturase-specific domain